MSDATVNAVRPDHEGSIAPAHVGMMAFLCSEAAFFSTLLVAYFLYMGESSIGPFPGEVLSLPLAVLNSIFLISSSGTIWFAVRAHTRDQRGAFAFWMLITIGLAVLFLCGTAYEWYGLIFHDGLTISRNLFGTTFFTLIGFHAGHVTVGIITMSVLVYQSNHSRLPAENDAPELVSWYWHLVDTVWIIIFLMVYLFGR